MSKKYILTLTEINCDDNLIPYEQRTYRQSLDCMDHSDICSQVIDKETYESILLEKLFKEFQRSYNDCRLTNDGFTPIIDLHQSEDTVTNKTVKKLEKQIEKYTTALYKACETINELNDYCGHCFFEHEDECDQDCVGWRVRYFLEEALKEIKENETNN